MSRIPALLQETVAERERVKQNIRKLRLHIQKKRVRRNSPLISMLNTLLEQKDILKGIAEKHAAAIAPLQEAEEEIREAEGETVLRSQRINKTSVHTLQESETRTKTRFTYHETSCVAEVEMDDTGIQIRGQHTLPLFIPFYINTFQFHDFQSIIHAIAQVLEAYCRRSESIKKVEDQYKELMLHGYVEKNYPRTNLKFKLFLSSPVEEATSEFMEVKLSYSLSGTTATTVDVNISGIGNDAHQDQARTRGQVFKQYPFFKAFENFLGISP